MFFLLSGQNWSLQAARHGLCRSRWPAPRGSIWGVGGQKNWKKFFCPKWLGNDPKWLETPPAPHISWFFATFHTFLLCRPLPGSSLIDSWALSMRYIMHGLLPSLLGAANRAEVRIGPKMAKNVQNGATQLFLRHFEPFGSFLEKNCLIFWPQDPLKLVPSNNAAALV